MSSLGPTAPGMPILGNGVTLTEVIGTTTSLKCSVCSTVEERGVGEGLRKTFCAAQMGDRQEHAIKIGRIRAKSRTDRIVPSYRHATACFGPLMSTNVRPLTPVECTANPWPRTTRL